MMTSREYFKGINIVYMALLAGQVFFILIALFLFYYGRFNVGAAELSEFLIYIVPVFVIAGILASNFLYRKRISVIKQKKELAEKLNDYRSILIIRLALLEGPSFFAIVCYLLTAQLIYLAFSALIIFIFLTVRPTRIRVITDLELNMDEQKRINDPESLVANNPPDEISWGKD
ncbi:MAG: hypothetical protein JW731_10990 [Bacteroidales bacterium]|nr:hypothetical protein [Bacteroidales bacterium]